MIKEIYNKKRFFAFTLAEVLITLVIIGVIAALTIPTVIKNTENKELLTRLKKFYAEGNQILIRMATDYGSAGNLASSSIFTGDLETDGAVFTKYIRTSKTCYPESGDCFAPTCDLKYNGGDTKDGSSWWASGYGLQTVDGMSLWITTYPCQPRSGSQKGDHLYSACGEIWVDVNGFKGPNRDGRDIFAFYISNGKGPLLYPLGGSESEYGTWQDNCTPDGDGIHCTSKIIEESWQMNY